MDRRQGVDSLYLNNHCLSDDEIESVTDIQGGRLVYDRKGDLSLYAPTALNKLKGQAVFIGRLQ